MFYVKHLKLSEMCHTNKLLFCLRVYCYFLSVIEQNKSSLLTDLKKKTEENEAFLLKNN